MKKKLWYTLIIVFLLVAAFAILGMLQSASLSEAPGGELSVTSFRVWMAVTLISVGTVIIGIYNLFSSKR